MARQIEIQQKRSRAERLRVTVISAALGGAAIAGASVAHEAFQPDTVEKQVTVEYGANTPTQWDAAHELREQGATESMRELVGELDAADPEHDNIVQPGQRATIHIDVPKE